MMRLLPKRWALLMSLAVLAAVLVACQPQAAQVEEAPEAEPTAPIIDLDPLETAEAEEEMAEDTTEEMADESAESNFVTEITTSPPEAKLQDTEVFTDDDRSPRLSTLTAAWGTDWNKRTVSTETFLSGGPPRDGIPSIDDPQFISFDEANEWLQDNEPVISLEVNGDARAYPIQIVTWHEIVNDTVGGAPIVVTFCPLCNSALAFDRRVGGEVLEFGVSGLLRNSDLIMYDRTTESLWQQFTGDSLVGELVPARLTFVSTQMISYADFKAAYPSGVVLSRETGHTRQYGRNPYTGYDTYQNSLSSNGNLVLFSGENDDRLEPVDRVVTVSLDDEGIDVAYPVNTLAEVGAINDTQGSTPLVVFHQFGTSSALGAANIADGEDVGATGVFSPIVGGELLTFTRNADGNGFTDDQTGSSWNIVGIATDGELAGTQLEPVVNGDHFWFSWAAFRPDTVIYSGS